MLRTTVGQLLINEQLPQEFRDYDRVYDKKTTAELLNRIAQTRPDEYRDIAQRLMDVGRDVAYSTGGFSFGVKHLRTPEPVKAIRQEVQNQIRELVTNKKLSPEERDAEIIRVAGEAQTKLVEAVLQHAKESGNPLADQIVGAGRGNKMSLNSLLGGDMLYTDHRGRIIPFPVIRSYSAGLSPAEYFAGSFGARKGIHDLKTATADAGYFCLSGNTPVLMGDGSIKPIAQICVGDLVMGADCTGKHIPVVVSATFRNSVKELQLYVFMQDEDIRLSVTASSEHRILIEEDGETRLVPIGRLAHLRNTSKRLAGSRLLYSELLVADVIIEEAFDLEVNHPDHLYVLANGLIVSNSKQLVQAAHRLIVTADDADENEAPEQLVRGLPVQTLDPGNEGALLAHPAGRYPRNTPLTPKILKELNDSGIDEILVRSPLVGRPRDGGVYARDVGIREKGVLPPKGDYVGIAAASAISEPLTQAQICLEAETAVVMANGSFKAIKDIFPGEQVLGSDLNGNTAPATVLERLHRGMQLCATILLVDPRNPVEVTGVCCTLEHKFLIAHEGGNVVEPIGWHQKGCLISTDGKEICIDKVIPCGARDTYDLVLNNAEHLFVLACGAIVSNSSKHSGGVAGATAGAISGFKWINQLVQVPKHFAHGGTHAQIDGSVSAVTPAPQGGYFITVAGQKHYAPHGLAVTVKPGDTVEAGDMLTDGEPNPAEIVKHKGIGEGGRYFVDTFSKALKNSDTPGHRRNIELVARGLINHVELADEIGDWAPEDVVPYHLLEASWVPREGHVTTPPSAAADMYLERPVLHYSVGTRVRPSVINKLNKFGITAIDVHKEPPPFRPVMIRGMAGISNDPDWMTKMLGSYQREGVLEAVRRGGVSDIGGTSYVPALAEGSNFGTSGLSAGYNPADLAARRLPKMSSDSFTPPPAGAGGQVSTNTTPIQPKPATGVAPVQPKPAAPSTTFSGTGTISTGGGFDFGNLFKSMGMPLFTQMLGSPMMRYTGPFGLMAASDMINNQGKNWRTLFGGSGSS